MVVVGTKFDFAAVDAALSIDVGGGHNGGPWANGAIRAQHFPPVRSTTPTSSSNRGWAKVEATKAGCLYTHACDDASITLCTAVGPCARNRNH